LTSLTSLASSNPICLAVQTQIQGKVCNINFIKHSDIIHLLLFLWQ
jgi:hypothetical protein